MNIIDTLYNINITKTKFFNLKGKNYLNMDLLKNNLYFTNKSLLSNGKKFNIMLNIEKNITSQGVFYTYNNFIIKDKISKVNYIIK
jgi:hypothetical protein